MPPTSTELIAAIDTQILSMVENPKPDYKMGDKTVTWSRYLRELGKLRKEYLANPDVDISIMTFEGFNTDELGVIK